MHNPLSRIIAELVLDKLFDIILSNFDCKIKFRTKYIDDFIFLFLSSLNASENGHNFEKKKKTSGFVSPFLLIAPGNWVAFLDHLISNRRTIF